MPLPSDCPAPARAALPNYFRAPRPWNPIVNQVQMNVAGVHQPPLVPQPIPQATINRDANIILIIAALFSILVALTMPDFVHYILVALHPTIVVMYLAYGEDTINVVLPHLPLTMLFDFAVTFSCRLMLPYLMFPRILWQALLMFNVIHKFKHTLTAPQRLILTLMLLFGCVHPVFFFDTGFFYHPILINLRLTTWTTLTTAPFSLLDQFSALLALMHNALMHALNGNINFDYITKVLTALLSGDYDQKYVLAFNRLRLTDNEYRTILGPKFRSQLKTIRRTLEYRAKRAKLLSTILNKRANGVVPPATLRNYIHKHRTDFKLTETRPHVRPQPQRDLPDDDWVYSPYDDLELDGILAEVRECSAYSRSPDTIGLTQAQYNRYIVILDHKRQSLPSTVQGRLDFVQTMTNLLNGISNASQTFANVSKAYEALPTVQRVVSSILDFVSFLYGAIKLRASECATFVSAKVLSWMSLVPTDYLKDLYSTLRSYLIQLIEGSPVTSPVGVNPDLTNVVQGGSLGDEHIAVSIFRVFSHMIFGLEKVDISQMRAQRITKMFSAVNTFTTFLKNISNLFREAVDLVVYTVTDHYLFSDADPKLVRELQVTVAIMERYLYEDVTFENAESILLCFNAFTPIHARVLEAAKVVDHKPYTTFMSLYQQFRALAARAKAVLKSNILKADTPVHYLSGPSGIGKTALANVISKYVAADHFQKETTDSCMYTKNFADDFDEAYDESRDLTIFADEVYQTKDPKINMLTSDFILRVTGNSPTPAKMAFAKKGQIFYKAHLLLLAANWPVPPSTIIGINFEEALYRRLTIVELVPKPNAGYDPARKGWFNPDGTRKTYSLSNLDDCITLNIGHVHYDRSENAEPQILYDHKYLSVAQYIGLTLKVIRDAKERIKVLIKDLADVTPDNAQSFVAEFDSSLERKELAKNIRFHPKFTNTTPSVSSNSTVQGNVVARTLFKPKSPVQAEDDDFVQSVADYTKNSGRDFTRFHRNLQIALNHFLLYDLDTTKLLVQDDAIVVDEAYAKTLGITWVRPHIHGHIPYMTFISLHHASINATLIQRFKKACTNLVTFVKDHWLAVAGAIASALGICLVAFKFITADDDEEQFPSSVQGYEKTIPKAQRLRQKVRAGKTQIGDRALRDQITLIAQNAATIKVLNIYSDASASSFETDGICIGSRTYLFPSHVLYPCEGGKFSQCQVTLVVGMQKYTFPATALDIQEFHRGDDNDRVLTLDLVRITFPKIVRELTDIRHLFVTNAEVDQSLLSSLVLSHFRGNTVHTQTIAKAEFWTTTALGSLEPNQEKPVTCNLDLADESFIYETTHAVLCNLRTELGDCGGLYARDNEKAVHKFFGMHVGTAFGSAVCVLLTQEIIEEFCPPKKGSAVQCLIIATKDGVRDVTLTKEPSQNYDFIPASSTYVGTLPKEESKLHNYPPFGSKIKRSPMFPEVLPVLAPANLTPKTLLNARVKLETPFVDVKTHNNLFQRLYKVYGDKFVHLAQQTQNLPGVLSMRDTLNQIKQVENFAGLKRETSSGFGKISKGKIDFIDFDLENTPTPILEDYLHEVVTRIAAGDDVLFPFLVTMKDELRRREKIDRPRIFFAGQLILLVLSKMFYGSAISLWLNHPAELHHLVGTDLNSSAGRVVYGDYAHTHGTYSDQANNDNTIVRASKVEFFQMLDRVCIVLDQQTPVNARHPYWPLRHQVRDAVAKAHISFISVYRDVMWRTDHAFPTGSLFTTPFNSVNQVVEGCHNVIESLVQLDHPLGHALSSEPSKAFDTLRARAYGDDGMFAHPVPIPIELIDKIDFESFGRHVTPADKGRGNEGGKFNILSRTPSPFGYRLPIDTVEAIPLWRWSNSIPDAEMCLILVDSALSEWFYYGPDVFETKRTQFNSELARLGYKSSSLTYAKLMSDYVSHM